jgi:hypothetical protein
MVCALSCVALIGSVACSSGEPPAVIAPVAERAPAGVVQTPAAEPTKTNPPASESVAPNTKRSADVLSTEMKTRLHALRTFPEVEAYLGPAHDVLGWDNWCYIWYFDDGTCLGIFSSEVPLELLWFQCPPGGFTPAMYRRADAAADDS